MTRMDGDDCEDVSIEICIDEDGFLCPDIHSYQSDMYTKISTNVLAEADANKKQLFITIKDTIVKKNGDCKLSGINQWEGFYEGDDFMEVKEKLMEENGGCTEVNEEDRSCCDLLLGKCDDNKNENVTYQWNIKLHQTRQTE